MISFDIQVKATAQNAVHVLIEWKNPSEHVIHLTTVYLMFNLKWWWDIYLNERETFTLHMVILCTLSFFLGDKVGI